MWEIIQINYPKLLEEHWLHVHVHQLCHHLVIHFIVVIGYLSVWESISIYQHVNYISIRIHNGRDQVEAEAIKKERIHGRTVQKILMEQIIMYGQSPRADILECEVRWALGSIVVSKASGCDAISVELYKTLKMLLSKCCTQYGRKIARPSSGHRTGKGQSSSKFLRRVALKNVLATGQFTHLFC